MFTPDPPTVATPASALRQLSVAILGFIAFGVFAKMTTPDRVTAPRDYPYDGLVKELGGIEENKVRAALVSTSRGLNMNISGSSRINRRRGLV